MSTRRTRATSRRSESSEPQEGPVTRQTRSSSKRIERMQSDIPQRGTRRRRRRSLESIATNDFPSSAARQTSPEHGTSPGRGMSPERPLTSILESENAEDMAVENAAAANTDSQNDSYEDKVARLRDLLDFDLPKLQRWCERAHEALSSFKHPEPTAEARRNFNAVEKSFKAARRPLAEDSVVYIDLSSSDLPYRDDPNDFAAVSRATRSANLISLLFSLVDVGSSKKALLPFLQELDDAFATFLDFGLPAQLESNDMAFRVRCHRLVESLRAERDSERLVLASAIFCTQPASTSEEARQRMGQGPFRKLGGIEQGGDFTCSTEFKTQVDEIITTLSLQESSEAESLLLAAFPQGELLEKLWAWALRTYIRVNKTEDDDDVPTNGQKEGETNNGLARDKSGGLHISDKDKPEEEINNASVQDEPEGLHITDNDQLEEEDSSDSDSSSGLEYNQLQTRTEEKSFIQDRVTLDAVRRSERGGPQLSTTEQPFEQKSARGTRSESEIGDAIRGLDAADILSPDDAHHLSGSRTATPGPGHLPPSRPRSRSTPKRPREDSDYYDEHDDDDDDFEVNEQLVDESMRVWYDSPRVVRNRSRFSGNVRQPRGGPPSRDVTLVGTKDLAQLSQVARNNRMANKGRPRQTRERWSDVDTNHLLDLIADESLNCSWSAIERKGGFQTFRNQQAIRDKARNLKKGYLCADAILPNGFDQVYLGKKERDEVIASGRNPDRTEDDVDEDGHVINSLWMEESS
ncbi:hypothetical protein F4861DRAFT_509050 [Xylaria intraflava]|nr:hypothetical protein F4861DRAFT_509050 [Xylaria intraflava]